MNTLVQQFELESQKDRRFNFPPNHVYDTCVVTGVVGESHKCRVIPQDPRVATDQKAYIAFFFFRADGIHTDNVVLIMSPEETHIKRVHNSNLLPQPNPLHIPSWFIIPPFLAA